MYSGKNEKLFGNSYSPQNMAKAIRINSKIYAVNTNGNIVRDNPRYIMFENCEICGHHNDLVYYPETNSFSCFSDKGDVGGTIIDYLKEVYKLTPSKAIKKFKKELCKKMEKVKWAWYPYIPAGKVTLLYGNPRRR